MSQQSPLPEYYRLAAGVSVRFVGVAIVVVAVAVFVSTLVVSLTGASVAWIVGVAALGVIAALTLGWWLRARAYVVRCGPQGYSVRFVRGAGVREARWVDVEEAVTAKPHGIPCLILRLKDGRRTTIPVGLLQIDREEFVRQMQRHLGEAQRRRLR